MFSRRFKNFRALGGVGGGGGILDSSSAVVKLRGIRDEQGMDRRFDERENQGMDNV